MISFNLQKQRTKKLDKVLKSLNRIIVNLFPLHNGYSIIFKSGEQCVESINLSYDEYEILQYIDDEQVSYANAIFAK